MGINYILPVDTLPQVPLSERRQYSRAKVSVSIELCAPGTNVTMRTETSDLSMGGCYVEAVFTMAVGTLVDISIWIGDFRVMAKGKVVTRHPNFGNGIEFLEIASEGEQRLRGFLNSLSPMRMQTRLGPWVR